MIIYVGDSSNIQNRILNNHCNGNVEGSALRRHVATAFGYNFQATVRPSGSTRVRIDLPDPAIGEANVSNYIQTGHWQFVICDTPNEARNFQWYVIQHLNPELNVNEGVWDVDNLVRYEELFEVLSNMEHYSYDNIHNIPPLTGVYVLHHENLPLPINQ